MIYFDAAATTFQKPPAVRQAVLRAMETMSSPGRGNYQSAALAAETLYACREEISALFGVEDPENVVFTSNATHALNLAIHSLVPPGGRVVISGYEHNAVTRPLHAIPELQIHVVNTPLFDQPAMLQGFRELVTEGTDAVICTHVSNVFGYILPIAEIARICRERGVPLIVDASQSAGSIPIHMGELGADFIAMPGHKGLYGPQGTGVLLCASAGKPLLCGGTGSNSKEQSMPDFLPDRMEAGTHNMPGIAGLLEGVRFVRRTGVEAIGRHGWQLKEQLRQRPGRGQPLPGLRHGGQPPPGRRPVPGPQGDGLRSLLPGHGRGGLCPAGRLPLRALCPPDRGDHPERHGALLRVRLQHRRGSGRLPAAAPATKNLQIDANCPCVFLAISWHLL